MAKIRLAIISKRKEIIRFLELEAISFGFDVSVFDRCVSDLYLFDACVVDPEGIRSLPVVLPQRVLLLEGGAYPQGDLFSANEITEISLPIPIRELNDFYARVLYGDGMTGSTAREAASVDKIYLRDNCENTVRYSDRYIQLSDCEMTVLQRLCKSCGEPVSREELNSLLGAQKGNIADVYICRLRKKLEPEDGKRLIFTVRSRGYKIMADMEWE